MNDIMRVTPAQGFGEKLMQLLSDPNVPADKLGIMLQMQRELIAERRKEAFQTAFVAMSAKMPQVRRDGTVELIKDGKRMGAYRFTRWEDMDKIMRPILAEFGFALMFQQLNGETGLVTVRGELIHIDGHSTSSERAMPPDRGPGRNDLQAIGSAISYCKRYIAEGLCNIVRAGQDDDAITAGERKITDEQMTELKKLLGETKTDLKTFMQMMVSGAGQLSDIRQRDYARLHNALSEKRRKQKEAKK